MPRLASPALAVLLSFGAATLPACGGGTDSTSTTTTSTPSTTSATATATGGAGGSATGSTGSGGSATGGGGGATGPVGCPCFDGDGTYCATGATARAAAAGCELGLGPGASDLLACQAGTWTLAEACSTTCESGESAASDLCGLPECPCFVKVAWCGASAAQYGLTMDPPCRVPLTPEHDQDILACNGPTWIVKEACANGCFQAPVGTPDACIDVRTPEDPGWDPCPEKPLLKWGLHPEASDRLRCAGIGASQISQTIGNAPASAGYHAEDGTVNGDPYCAATDLRTVGMSNTEIKALLDKLGRNGFAAWYRWPGHDGWPSSQAPHIHVVFAGVKMKSQLRGQVRDFLLGLNGLSSHTAYTFWSPSQFIEDVVRLLFQRNYTP